MFRSDRDPTDLAGMHTVKLGHEITGEVLYDQHKHVPYSKKYVPYDTLWLAKLPNDYSELSHRRYIALSRRLRTRREMNTGSMHSTHWLERAQLRSFRSGLPVSLCFRGWTRRSHLSGRVPRVERC